MEKSVLLLSCALALMPRAVHAKDDRATAAKQHYETGMAHYQLEEWDQAVAEWETGFRTKPAPQFLYNIAQAYRLSKRPEKAVSFYQKYLRMDPKAPNKAEVEEHIKNLERAIDEQKKASSSPPFQPIPTDGTARTPEPGAAPASTPSSLSGPLSITGHPPEKSPAGSMGESTDESTRGRDKPVYKKAWFWGVMAGAAVVLAAGVTTGVVLGTSDNTPTLPAARF